MLESAASLTWLLRVPWGVGLTLYERASARFGLPSLEVDFENREPWRRLSNIVNRTSPYSDHSLKNGIPFQAVGLFFRIRIGNAPGRRIATRVRGRLVDVVDQSGKRDDRIDSFDLHWVGSPPDGSASLNGGQAEFLDVFFVEWDKAVLFDAIDKPISLYPADASDRGIPFRHQLAGQTLRIRVMADNAPSVWVELKLPDGVAFGTDYLTVQHRVYREQDVPGQWQETLAPTSVAARVGYGEPAVLETHVTSTTAPPTYTQINSIAPPPATLYRNVGGTIPSLVTPESDWWKAQEQRFEHLASADFDAGWSVVAETGEVEWFFGGIGHADAVRVKELFTAEARAAGLRLSRVSPAPPKRFPWLESTDPVDAWLNVVAAFPDDGKHPTGSGHDEHGRRVSGGISKVVAGSRLVSASIASGHRPDPTAGSLRMKHKLARLAELFERQLNQTVTDGFGPDAIERLNRAAEDCGAEIAALCGPSERQLFLLAPPHALAYSAVRPAAQHHWQKATGRLVYLHDLAKRWPTL